MQRQAIVSLWIDDWHPVGEPEGKRVFHEEHSAVKHMQKEIDKTDTPEELKVVNYLIDS